MLRRDLIPSLLLAPFGILHIPFRSRAAPVQDPTPFSRMPRNRYFVDWAENAPYSAVVFDATGQRHRCVIRCNTKTGAIDWATDIGDALYDSFPSPLKVEFLVCPSHDEWKQTLRRNRQDFRHNPHVTFKVVTLKQFKTLLGN